MPFRWRFPGGRCGCASTRPELRPIHRVAGAASANTASAADVFTRNLPRITAITTLSGKTYAGKMLRMNDGKASRVVDTERKQRTDFRIPQPMRDWIWQQLAWRMVPAVQKAFRFNITRYEYLQVGRYTAEDSGHFIAHRDDGNAANAHRRFAITANLSDGYDGGELSFPEYGASFKPGAGDAIVFSCSLLHEALTVTRGERFMLVGMFWGEGEVAQYERSLALREKSPKPQVAPPIVRRKQIASARRCAKLPLTYRPSDRISTEAASQSSLASASIYCGVRRYDFAMI